MLQLKSIVGTLIFAAILFLIGYQLKDRFDANKIPKHFDVVTELETNGVPEFSVGSLDGTIFNYNSIKNSPVIIISFWASWCEPCLEEFPSMIKLTQHFKDDVIMLAISNDDELDDIKNFVNAFKGNESLPLNLKVLWDQKKLIAKKFEVSLLPESFIISKNKLIKKVVGTEDWYNPSSIAYFERMINKAKK